MTGNLRYFAVAVAAPILVTILIARALPKERRPPVLWLCAAGAATGYLAFFLEGFVVPAFLGTSVRYLSPLELAFGLVGPIEEIVKIPVLQSQLTSHQNFSGRSAAIMGTAIGSGFAALENAMYFYSAGAQWPDLALTRLLTATPFHMANGAIAGILVWKGVREDRPLVFLGALALAILLHGAYDAPLFVGGAQMAKFAFALGLTLSIAIGSYRKLPAA